jgi:hypothetical protein
MQREKTTRHEMVSIPVQNTNEDGYEETDGITQICNHHHKHAEHSAADFQDSEVFPLVVAVYA